MAQLYVSNLNFESTANNQLTYGSNIVTVRLGGGNTLVVNSSGLSVAAGKTFSGTVVGGGFAPNNSVTTVNSSITVTGAVILNGNVTPTAIAANTANWAPGVSNVYSIRVSGNNNVANSEYMITGMSAGTNGQIVVLHNVGPMGIIIRNEEAGSNSVFFAGVNVPSSTAANRFSMPNHFKLQGYQSAAFYYDGALNRWRPTDSLSVPFDHKKGLTKGFFSGGASPTGIVATADRTTYSTEVTAAVAGANLSQARGYLAGAGNACKAFFSGGYTATTPAFVTSTRTDRTIYSTEATAVVSGAALSQGRAWTIGAGTSCKGFIASGQLPPAISAVSDRTTYATETTASVPAANLSQARNAGAAAGNSDKGFYSGGEAGATPAVSTTDRILYATEVTAAVPGANLTQARPKVSAAGNACKGFFSGGQGITAPANIATTCRTIYSIETTAAVPGANLSQARSGLAAAGNSCKGFYNGGASVSVDGTPVPTSDRIDYNTETRTAIVGANLSQARLAISGV